ncbi:MAG: nucleotidyltransferase [Rhodothermales bacterium]
MDTFASLLAALGRAGVDFVVVGGLAVAFVGYARVTDDVDILVDADPANLRSMLDVLTGFGEGAAAELSPDDFPMEEGCVRVAETFDLDIFTQMSGLTYADLLLQTATQEVEGVPIRHLTAEGLLRLKTDSLRPKDQLDVAALRAILRGEQP